MNICPDCYNDVSEWETHCKCGWEKPKRVHQPIQKIFTRLKREPETEATRIARERCMETAKTFRIGSSNPHQWAEALAEQVNAGKRLTVGQMSKLEQFERMTGRRLVTE